MEEANKGLDAIQGNFKNDKLKKMLTELYAEAVAVEDDALVKTAGDLFNKYELDGLTMKEINQVKRMFEKENTFNYLRNNEARAYKRATNIDNAVREWQFQQADLNGLDNLREINKETQANFSAAKSIQSKITRQLGNNEISITDWIMAAGALSNPQALAALVGKKMISSASGQKMYNKLIQKYDKTPQVKPPVADLEKIGKMQSFKQTFKDGNNRLSPPGYSSRSATRLDQPVQLPG